MNEDQREARLSLEDRAGAVRAGRHFVETTLRDFGAGDVVGDACIVAGELLANAQEHGSPPVEVIVRVGDGVACVYVKDASSRAPVRPAVSTTNMTGRGLTIVAALAARWGIQRDTDGKVVWAQFVTGAGESAGSADLSADIDPMLAGWDDEAPEPTARYTVVLGDVSTDLLIQAKAHIDNLVREFRLAGTGAASGGTEVPEHLATLIETVVHEFADARDAIKRQALAAMHRGEPRTNLTLHLPLSAADAGEAYLDALDDADGYARAARLLTLETPPDHRLFRRWYVQAVVDQLRATAADAPSPEPVPFDDVLVAEVRRLSAAQRISDRAARLQRVTAALSRARTPEDVAHVVLTEGVEALGASGGGLLVPAGDGQHVAVPGVVGYGSELLDALREEPLDAPLPAATAMRTDRAIWLETREDTDREFPALVGFEAASVAMCAVPLTLGGDTLGALRFSFTQRKLFDEDERRFVQALAALTAQTLQRTELYAAEREAALGLQRALLPEHLPDVSGWSVATHYSPAGKQEAGGDFYDLIELPDGTVAGVVGDVMGRGIEAAAAMALVRSTIGAFATDNPDPADVFARVDRFFQVRDVEQLVTAVYFLVDADGTTVHVVNAGHIPPLLVRGGECGPLTMAGGPPFGLATHPRGLVTITLGSGDAMVVVTDGLVERRHEDIDEGIARVVTAVCDAPLADTAGDLLARVLRASAQGRLHDDDVTALVMLRK